MSIFSALQRGLVRLASNRQVQRAVTDLAIKGWNDFQNRKRGESATVGKNSSDTAPGHTPAHRYEPATTDSKAPFTITYAPSPDGRPDPGEIVWAWVPFEEDASKGKDRPVLVLAEESPTSIVTLMLTSRDRGTGDHTDEHGNRWIDIGTGEWDSKGRPSEVRIDRLIRLDPRSVRREGGRLDETRFNKVAKATLAEHGW